MMDPEVYPESFSGPALVRWFSTTWIARILEWARLSSDLLREVVADCDQMQFRFSNDRLLLLKARVAGPVPVAISFGASVSALVFHHPDCTTSKLAKRASSQARLLLVSGLTVWRFALSLRADVLHDAYRVRQ